MTRRALITGISGMVGSHLAELLLASGHDVVGTFYRPTIDMNELPAGLRLLEVDVRYEQHVQRVFEDVRPDWIFHLAAQSHPTVSWERPQETLASNVIGTANIFEAVKGVRRYEPSYDPVVVVAGSSAEYGASFLDAQGPIKEDAQLLPLHPYGVSKVATDLLTLQYYQSDRIRAVTARIFNTSGPRKTGDVISDFARRIAALPAAGGEIPVGNLSTKRAFLHVADLIQALVALAEGGTAGQAYNISGEAVVSIAELIPMFEAVSGKPVGPVVDEKLLRPTDEPIIYGDNGKIRAHTGWTPRLSIGQLVHDLYMYERGKLRI